MERKRKTGNWGYMGVLGLSSVEFRATWRVNLGFRV